jgi:hypothetical protein
MLTKRKNVGPENVNEKMLTTLPKILATLGEKMLVTFLRDIDEKKC